MKSYMQGIENDPNAFFTSPNFTNKHDLPLAKRALYAGALTGLGSKLLAIGAPQTLALLGTASESAVLQDAIIEAHTLLFGPLELRVVSCTAPTNDIERALASDIVCMAYNVPFSMEWIAEATHINLLSPWCFASTEKSSLQEWEGAASLTHCTRSEPQNLSDVISGVLCGRMGEEITVLSL